jgi:cytochrome c556
VLAIGICFFAASFAALAAPRLKPLMRNWKSEAARAEAMVLGAAPYDEAELRRILGVFVADSQAIEAGVAGRSAQALDLKSRFSRFEADASAVLAASSARDSARSPIARLRRECGACHDAFAN